MKPSYQSKCANVCGKNRHAITPVVGRAPKQNGQAMLELALVLPILLLLVMGVIEFGRAFYYGIEVSDAARAGAQYASQSMADAQSLSSITVAAQNNAPDIGGALGVALQQPAACGCPGAAAGGCPAAGCNYPLVYVTVTTTYPFNTLFAYPGIPSTFNLTGVSTMPVQRQ